MSINIGPTRTVSTRYCPLPPRKVWSDCQRPRLTTFGKVRQRPDPVRYPHTRVTGSACGNSATISYRVIALPKSDCASRSVSRERTPRSWHHKSRAPHWENANTQPKVPYPATNSKPPLSLVKNLKAILGRPNLRSTQNSLNGVAAVKLLCAALS